MVVDTPLLAVNIVTRRWRNMGW